MTIKDTKIKYSDLIGKLKDGEDLEIIRSVVYDIPQSVTNYTLKYSKKNVRLAWLVNFMNKLFCGLVDFTPAVVVESEVTAIIGISGLNRQITATDSTFKWVKKNKTNGK